MSLQPQAIPPVPEETARIARAILPKGNTFIHMRDELGTFFRDEDFLDLFSEKGQPAESAWRLALVMVMQYAEGLTDRQAADAVRTRIDWKYALSLEITDPGFDFSVLSEFRSRLLANQAERRLFDVMLSQFRERGWIKERGKQRTDSTHVLAAVRAVNRLECVGETMRHALNILAELPPSALLIQSPYDIEARYSKKKTTGWVGYKVHFTEGCDSDQPHLLLEVTTTLSTTADGEVVEDLHERLAEKQVLPDQHLVDTGYVDAENIAKSQQDHQIDLVGPALPDTSWSSKEAERFDQSQFSIDWEAKSVICPAGQKSRDWGHIPDRHGKPSLRIRFPLPVCRSCPLHAQCTPVSAKVLILRPDQQSFQEIKEARKRQGTPEFRAIYAKRAGIEGTVAQAVRTCEIRRSRYIGLKKLNLQAFLTATSMNVLRACHWLAEEKQAAKPSSRFAKLVASVQQQEAA